MGSERRSVCMLYQGQAPHTAHQTFGEGVEADYRHFETGSRPDPDASGTAPAPGEGSTPDRVSTGLALDAYDVVIAEGSAPLQTALVYGIRHPSASILYLAADETFLTLDERASRHLWRGLRPVVNRVLDGVITVSQDAYQWAVPHLGTHPVEVVHPPITQAKHKHLRDIDPASPSDPFTVLTAGNAQTSKQPERLVDAVDELRSALDCDVRAVFLGRGHSEREYAERDWIRTPGYVDLDVFAEWFEAASVYVQPSDGDTCPVASLEGMLSATPTVVTATTGSREFVPDQLEAAPSSSSVADVLFELAAKSEAERCEIGEQLRTQVLQLQESRQRNKFKQAVTELTH